MEKSEQVVIEQQLESFEDFEQKVSELRGKILKATPCYRSTPEKLLFRGHAKASWALETSLERHLRMERLDRSYTLDEYNELVYLMYAPVYAHTKERWCVVRKCIFDKVLPPETLPNYEFMVYLRHQGFPSPLLDWTLSQYVAAYFAFEAATDDEDVAVFAYVHTPDGGTVNDLGKALIVRPGPYVRTHKRHYAQQARYTAAIQRSDTTPPLWKYCPHLDALQASLNQSQYYAYKYILTGRLRRSVLKKLDEMNINAFTLFGSEEGLMKMLAFRDITLRNLRKTSG